MKKLNFKQRILKSLFEKESMEIISNSAKILNEAKEAIYLLQSEKEYINTRCREINERIDQLVSIVGTMNHNLQIYLIKTGKNPNEDMEDACMLDKTIKDKK